MNVIEVISWWSAVLLLGTASGGALIYLLLKARGQR